MSLSLKFKVIFEVSTFLESKILRISLNSFRKLLSQSYSVFVSLPDLFDSSWWRPVCVGDDLDDGKDVSHAYEDPKDDPHEVDPAPRLGVNVGVGVLVRNHVTKPDGGQGDQGVVEAVPEVPVLKIHKNGSGNQE